MTPVDLKNRGAYFDFAKETELNDSIASTGSVPRAKKNIIENPEINEPLDNAENCID